MAHPAALFQGAWQSIYWGCAPVLHALCALRLQVSRGLYLRSGCQVGTQITLSASSFFAHGPKLSKAEGRERGSYLTPSAHGLLAAKTYVHPPSTPLLERNTACTSATNCVKAARISHAELR